MIRSKRGQTFGRGSKIAARVRLRKRPAQSSITFESFGVAVRVDFDDPELEDAIQDVLPPGWVETRGEGSSGQFSVARADTDSYTVTVGGQAWLEDGTLDVALGLLDAQIRLHIAANTRDWVFVHAGVVAEDERAVLLPGHSFAGKTTLVKAMVEAGAKYFSDEFAVLDSQGRVHPYPRRLSVRAGDGRSVQEVDIADLGGRAAEQAVEVAIVALARYRSDAKWSPRELSRGEGVLALMANAVPAQERPGETLQALSRAVDAALIFQGDRGEAGPTATALLELLRSGG